MTAVTPSAPWLPTRDGWKTAATRPGANWPSCAVLGLFDRPADAGCIECVAPAEPAIDGLTEPLVGVGTGRLADWNLALSSLAEPAGSQSFTYPATLINRQSILIRTSGNISRSNYARKIPTPGARRTGGSTNTSARHTKEGDQPTLEDLQPLYQAVAHGCQAGLQQDDGVRMFTTLRILTTRQKHYQYQKTWALSVSDLRRDCLLFRDSLEVPSHLPSMRIPSSLAVCNEAAFCLRALGRSERSPSNRCEFREFK